MSTITAASKSLNHLFIDAAVSDYQDIVENAPDNTLVTVIEPTGDPLLQIARVLAQSPDKAAAIHILSHGGSGELLLGGQTVDIETLRASAAVLERIGDSLSEDGDILLYGCNVAAGTSGEAFLAALADATAADVASSDDPTGAAGLGGDWLLESRVGTVESDIISWAGQAQYAYLLATDLNFDSEPVGQSGTASKAYGDFTFTGDGSANIAIVDDGNITSATDYALRFDSDFAADVNTIGFSTTDGSEFALNSLEIDSGLGDTAITITGKRDGSVVETANIDLSSNSSDGGASYVGSNNGIITFTGWDNIDEIVISGPDPATYGLDIDLDDIDVGPAVPPNTAPTFTSDTAFSVAETATNDSSVLFDVQANDGDGGATDANVTYSIVGGTGQSYFGIDSDDGEIRLNATGAAALDHEDTDSVTLTIRADDGEASNNTADQTITVSVSDVAPVIDAGQSFGVNESDTDGTSVGTVATTGDDDSVTYSIQSGNTGTAFAINGSTGEITVNDTSQLDASATGSYTLGIRASDGTTDSDESVTINVTDDVAPAVTDIAVAGTPNANDASMDFTVTFDESVSNVSTDDFTLTTTGSAGGNIASVSGSGTTYTVSVDSLTGDGSLRLDLNGGTDIDDGAGNAPAAYTSGTTHTVDRVAPTMTDANISLSGASGTGGAFKVGDTVTVTWDDTAGGDNNSDTISGVTADFSAFGGGAAVAASNSSGTWTATYTIVSGAIDGTNKNVSVTATDDAANATTTSDTTNATVDNDSPTVTDGNVAVTTTGSGTGGAFIAGDTVTVEWGNGSDGNGDLAGATADFSAFGGGAAVAMTDVNGDGTLYRASYTLVAGSVDGSNLNASVTATDDAGNTTTTADTSNLTADTQAPTVTDGNLSLSGASGSGGAFIVGDTVTATWNDTAGGDNNSDTISGVTVDFSAFGGGAAVAASNSSGTWTATYTITEEGGGSIDATGLDVSATVTDDAGNSTTTADTTGATVDNDSPGTPSGTLAVVENSANATVVGTVTGGGSDGVTYSLTDDAGGRFVIDGAGNVTVADGGLLDHESNASHDITVRATDDAGNTTDAALTVTVNDVNEVPTVDLDGDDSSGAGGNDYATSFSAGGAAVAIADADAALADVDAGDQIESLTVTLDSRPDGDGVESLSLDATATAAASGLTVSYTAATGILSVTGAADTATYQTILRGIQYDNGDAAADITTGDRTISVVANDGSGDSLTATSTVTVVTAPVIDLGGDGGSGDLAGSYAEGDGVVQVTSSATVSEPDGDNLNQVVIQLTNAQDGTAEKITLSGGSGARGGITVSYDSDTQITLAGSDTAANYQALLRELQYQNGSDDPDTTNRTFTVQGTDVNGNTGATATLSVAMTAVNDAPTLTATGDDPTFTEDGGVAGLFSGTAIDAVESADNVSELTLTVSDLADGSDELLSVDGEEIALTDGTSGTTTANGFGYAVSLSGTTATVTLSKSDSAANWQTLVDGLGYRNGSDTPDTTARTVTLTAVSDTGGTANGGSDTTALAVASTVGVTAVNDAPVIATNAGPSVQTGSTVTLTSTHLDEGDPDDDGTGLTYTLDTLPAEGKLFLSGTELAVSDTFTQQDIDDGKVTFTAGSTTGNVSFDITLADGGEDAAGTVSDTVTLSVTAPPPAPSPDPEPDPEPEPTPLPNGTTTEDGATVTRQTTTTEDGRSVQVTEVAATSDDREEDPETPNGSLADITLAADDDGGEPVLRAGLPTGVGLRSEGAPTRQSREEALADLIARIEQKTLEDSAPRAEMTGIGQSFLDALPESSALFVRTVTPSVGDGVEPSDPITITGASTSGRQEALVIDVSQMPSGSVLQLDDVDFAAIVGEARVIGGTGANVVTGDDSAQFIVLGEDDDELHGGGGDDTIGSEGGRDVLSGGAGNDTVFGGTGHDFLIGGAGDDTLRGDSGIDAVFYEDTYAASSVTRSSDGAVTVSGGDGIDQLSDVEILVFADDRVDLVSVPSVTADRFDEEVYLGANPDVAAAVAAGHFSSGMAHFQQYGEAENRSANPLFDATWYLEMNPDVAAAVQAGKMTAWEHYTTWGWREGRDAGPFFDQGRYLAENPDVAAAEIDPLRHFLQWGWEEGRALYMSDADIFG